MKVLKITKQDLERMASDSLQGMLIKYGCILDENGKLLNEKIQICFEKFSIKQIEKNGGNPDLIMMYDFVPECLCQSILDLCKQGFDIEISHWFRED